MLVAVLALFMVSSAPALAADDWNVCIRASTPNETLTSSTEYPVGSGSNPILVCLGSPVEIQFSAEVCGKPPVTTAECVVDPVEWEWSGAVSNGSQTVSRTFLASGPQEITVTAKATYVLKPQYPNVSGCPAGPVSKSATLTVKVVVMTTGADWTVIFSPSLAWPNPPTPVPYLKYWAGTPDSLGYTQFRDQGTLYCEKWMRQEAPISTGCGQQVTSGKTITCGGTVDLSLHDILSFSFGVEYSYNVSVTLGPSPTRRYRATLQVPRWVLMDDQSNYATRWVRVVGSPDPWVAKPRQLVNTGLARDTGPGANYKREEACCPGT